LQEPPEPVSGGFFVASDWRGENFVDIFSDAVELPARRSTIDVNIGGRR